MFFNLIFVCLLSTALFVKVEGSVKIQPTDDDDVPSIDEQVAPLGTDNVFCLFTYGNWVMPSNMQQDVPTAVYAGVSRLPFHRLDFSYFSQELKGSFPTIVPDCGYEVWGSVYLIPVQDLDTVLLKGGIVDNKKVFHFVQTVVEAYSNGNIINVKCNAFQQSPIPEKLIYGLALPQDRRPSQQILDMLTESYTDGGLPPKYVEEVSQIPTLEQGYIETNTGPGPNSQLQQKPATVVAAPNSVTVAPKSAVVDDDDEDDTPPAKPISPYGVPPVQQQVFVQTANNQQKR